MFRTTLAILAAGALMAGASWFAGPTAVGQTAAPAPEASTQPTEKFMGDFEDGLQGWEGANEAKVSIVEEHATHGAKALKADLPVGPYPGVGIEFRKPQDWTEFHALRLSVFNASKGTVALSVRIDDAGSKNFATRYNGDMYPFKLNPGANEVEVTMAALKEGGFCCRGLDIDKIRQVRFFCTPKQPLTMYFDNIRLVTSRSAGPDTLVLADFDANNPAKFAAAEGAKAAVADKALKVEFTPEGGEYPRLAFTGMNGDWLTYDLLSMEIECPKTAPSPPSIAAKLIDSSGRNQTCTIPLDKGVNKIEIPLEVWAEVGLGKINELSLFRGAPQVKEEMIIRKVALVRSNFVDFPAVRDDKAEDAAVTLDMTALKVPRNTSFMAMVYIPLADGKTRLVRCNSAWEGQVRGANKYAIPAAAMANCDKDKPVRAWVFVSDHGVWSYWLKSDKYAGKPITLTFVGGQG
ncbi:MAG: hypothetical protein ACE15C_01830 [Phycisphaerae bacterium]